VDEFAITQNPQTLYAKEGDKLIGGVIAFICGDILWIDSIWITPENRNKNLGSELIEKLINSTSKIKEIQLNTFSKKAHKFFAKLDFETVAIIPNWKYGLDMFLMKKVVLI
jgi:N-acetylglutamate synthase-like GNAT family acetyltransferase